MTEPDAGPKPDAAPAPLRVVIGAVTPELDGGRYAIKRIEGERVVVEADLFADGHDVVVARLLHRRVGESAWDAVPMAIVRPGLDRFGGRFVAGPPGRYEYTVRAWVDRPGSWRRDLAKKAEAGQDVASELLEGAQHFREAAARARRDGSADDAAALIVAAGKLEATTPQADRVEAALMPALVSIAERHPDLSRAQTYEKFLPLVVDRELARFGAWYELFPRSCAPDPGCHGTFADVEARLPYVARLGFDVLYLPPVHPIGRAYRKGPNNSLTPGPDDVGSPWAIGGAEGGHTDVHPDLGTLADFDRLVAAAGKLGIEIALDIAYQCSPDHPYVRDHPGWFRHRPDGTIKYAENPPKKYQDIYPIDFECDDWRGLWDELLRVFLFWCGHAVTIFRVDNPHTKSFRYWEWAIAEVKARHPGAIFLAEAFTRPRVLHHLAKAGFTQSYTYFTWRNDREGLVDYLNELATGPGREYLRPNLFANTPDILHEYLQHGGPAAFRARLVLAATLGATYGIYGPPFEQAVGAPAKPGSEEYLDSEKYQVRHWDLDAPGNLAGLIARVNAIRRSQPALRSNESLRFGGGDNPQLIAYTKSAPDGSGVVLTVVNLDPHRTQAGWVRIGADQLGFEPAGAYRVRDLLDDAEYLWRGDWNFVALDPAVRPAHVFSVSR